MILTNEQFEVVIAELNRMLLSKRCHLCRAKKFSLGSYVMEMRSYTSDKLPEADMPLIPVCCDNCGNVLFISAKFLENKRIERVATGNDF